MESYYQLFIDYKTFISTETTTLIEFYILTYYVSAESLISLTDINAYLIHNSLQLPDSLCTTENVHHVKMCALSLPEYNISLPKTTIKGLFVWKNEGSVT